ncbi:MAG: tol-pal system YbgF family protein [Puniceicoccaceae bacterium]
MPSINRMLKWPHMAPWRIYLLLAAVLPGGSLQGQVAEIGAHQLVPDGDNTEQLNERLRLNWQLEGITAAIESGFLEVADTLVGRLLEREDLIPEVRGTLFNHQLHIALILGDLEAAATALANLEAIGIQADPLSRAFSLFYSNDLSAVEDILESLPDGPGVSDRLAWRTLLEGLVLSRKGEVEAAFETFEKAESQTSNPLLQDQFEIIRLREEMNHGVSDETTISALRESVRSMAGERGGFEAARLLAIALARTGQSEAAIEILTTQLTVPGLREFNLRSDFLLLVGLIAGPDSPRGNLALREIVGSDARPDLQSVALTLVAQSVVTDEDRRDILLEIEQWLDRVPPHPLADRLLAYQAYFLSLDGDFDSAGDSSRLLLQLYPTSSFAANALRMLAYTSWNQSPPRYRTAADYLNQLRQRFPNTEESLEAGILIADCYFLNGDYANASTAYGAILKDVSDARVPGIFYQRILAEIAAGQPDSAAQLLDEARAGGRLTREALWQAEWNLLDSFRRQGSTQKAFERIQAVLNPLSGPASGLAPSLALRFRWLEARLTLEAGPPVEAIEKARQLTTELDQGSYEGLPGELVSEVRSHLLLLQGEAEIAAGQRQAGLGTFASLRESYPDSGPTILSYLVESRSEAGSDNLVSAQQNLVSLVDRFPDSEYAPIALWEAALNAEQRGLNIHLQEAIGILERLVNGYPSHELVYYARLKQGDLARRLNDFPTALLLYERLLALFPNHPERYRAELSRADCLLAIGSNDPARFDQAAVIYERNCLLPSVPLPVRVEAGFKWAHALGLQGDSSGAETVYWLVFERFVEDRDLGQAIVQSAPGRYWLARTLIELGDMQVEKGQVASARRIFETVLQKNLPGKALAQTRLDSLQ